MFSRDGSRKHLLAEPLYWISQTSLLEKIILADMSLLFISNTIFCGSDYLNFLDPKWKWRDLTNAIPRFGRRQYFFPLVLPRICDWASFVREVENRKLRDFEERHSSCLHDPLLKVSRYDLG